MKRFMTFSLMLFLSVACISPVLAGEVQEKVSAMPGYEMAENYWVGVAINDLRGRLVVQLLNEFGEPTLTGIPSIDGTVTLADGEVVEVTFRPEKTYYNESDDAYVAEPDGFSSTYYIKGKWLQGVGCVDVRVTVEGKDLDFRCFPR